MPIVPSIRIVTILTVLIVIGGLSSITGVVVSDRDQQAKTNGIFPSSAKTRRNNHDVLWQQTVEPQRPFGKKKPDVRVSTSVYGFKKLSAIAAAALALALGIAIPTSINSDGQADLIKDDEIFALTAGVGTITALAQNDLPFPVPGPSFPDDGCGDASVRFGDGRCHSVLRRGPCSNPRHWMTVDPITLSGTCRPRLCGKGRVFVGGDGLCHDVLDALECSGGRRLYYTAYGDPICDCPDGQFPFPGPKDNCVALFTRGPCPIGQWVAIDNRSGTLSCMPAECQSRSEELPVARHSDGFCYVLGSQGPCGFSPAQFLGFDVFRRRTQCVDTRSPQSPYFTSRQEDAFLAATFNQLYANYDSYRVSLVSTSLRRNETDAGPDRRQDIINTSGVFQLPGSLLNPCRPGARSGNNFKCTSPFVSSSRRPNVLQAVRSAFECQSATAPVLQATGQCGSNAQAANCGPSYQFNAASGQCRKTL